MERIWFVDGYKIEAVRREAWIDYRVYEDYLTNPCLYIEGYVKWDGCSNWSFNPGRALMVHFCGPSDAEELRTLFLSIYRDAAERMDI